MPPLNYVSTGRPEYDQLFPRIRDFLEQDTMDMNIDGEAIHGYRSPDSPAIWLRDHSDMMRGFRFFEKDLKSAVDHFAATQARNGRIFDYFTVQPSDERENWCKYVRVPVEADVEYRFVKAAYLAWQATGDDAWIASLIEPMERALNYAFTHPHRWDEKRQLVKRAYTIDSWDFAYSAGTHDWLQFQIDENTFWGIMHGDNSGYYEACRLLARIQRHLGQSVRANHWEQFAESLKARMNEICWNGDFYTHFVKDTPVTIEGVDESSQLSFSNAMNINREAASHNQAVSILREYQRRASATGFFAEWFSIEPPFPSGIFGDEKLVEGAYCNGGIMPLVGGELARAYFNHGFEIQGVDTLRRYYQLISQANETYLWYFPDGSPSSVDTSTSPDAMPTDGWGSSSMLHGFIEGLVGIEDQSKLLRETRISPRWHAANVTQAEAWVGYEVSGASIGYLYDEKSSGIRISVTSENTNARFHVLLPQDATIDDVSWNGKSIAYANSTVQQSRYADFQCQIAGGADFSIRFK